MKYWDATETRRPTTNCPHTLGEHACLVQVTAIPMFCLLMHIVSKLSSDVYGKSPSRSSARRRGEDDRKCIKMMTLMCVCLTLRFCSQVQRGLMCGDRGHHVRAGQQERQVHRHTHTHTPLVLLLW